MYKILIPILALFLFKNTTAQHRPTKLWDASFGGSDYETLTRIKQTSDNGFMLCGTSYSGISGDKTQDKKGTSSFTDFWIVKTDSAGHKTWDKTYGGRYSDVAADIIETRDGGYLIGGYSESDTSGDKSQLSRGGRDYWVIKTSVTGIKQWDARFGGTRDENLRAMIQTSEGGYILAGSSDSRNTGDKTQDTRDLNALRTDYWIVCIDSMGNKLWDATYGGNSNDQLHSIVKSRDGGYLLVGETYSDQGFERSSYLRGVSDYWVVKINHTGTKLWDATYGGSQSEILNCAIQTADGGYLLGGGSRSGISGEKSDTCRGFDDSWLVKIDSLGRVQWDKTFGGDGQEYVDALFQNTDGGYIYATSSSSNLVGDKTQDKMGNFDYWLVRTDSAGNKLWDARYGSLGDDYLFSMVRSNDYGLVLAGQSNGGNTADKSQVSRGGLDYWIIKLLNNQFNFTLSSDTLCLSSLSHINYDVTGSFNTNKIRIQLSNINGNFSSYTTLDSFTVNGTGRFTGVSNFIIPALISAGTQYRLRIVSNNPADTIISHAFVIRNCCSSFARPVAGNGTGELYGTNNCEGESLFLLSSVVNGATGYHWSGPSGFTSNERNPVITNITSAKAGIYTVYAYNLSCTSDTSSINIVVHALPATPQVSNTGPYSDGDTIHLHTNTTAVNYQWIGPYPFSSTLANPFIAHAQSANAGYYRLKINTGGPCWSLYDSTLVIVNHITRVSENDAIDLLSIYPNPVKAGDKLTISSLVQHKQEQVVNVKLYDSYGKLIIVKKDMIINKNADLNVPCISGGTYFLHLTLEDKLIVKKIGIE